VGYDAVTVMAHGLPLLYVVALWFASTALVVWLDNRASRSFGSSLSVAGIFAVVGVGIIAVAARDASKFAIYASFTATFLVWGYHEMSFLMGKLTGPRRMPCPASARGWTRFTLSAQTVIYHEIALALTLALLAALAWGQVNITGVAAFAILFAMRLSTKLNIFLGVPNFSSDILPPQLAYLKSYFRNRAFNPLMPVSLLLGVALTCWLGSNALAASGDAAVTWSLLTGLALLGVVEHLFLVLPIGDTALWRWAIPSAKRI
jgi:putative photosynthetic complex assembly protein 2